MSNKHNDHQNALKSLLCEIESELSGLKSTFEKAEGLVKTIEGISSKTDLLALNASIEAARAGQAGRGFAVVAEDVSKLSEKTQSSIEEVKDVLISIQDSIEKVSRKIISGKQLSQKNEMIKIAA